MTSNLEGRPNDQEVVTVENKGFQMPPLSISARIGEIYTIRFLKGLIRTF